MRIFRQKSETLGALLGLVAAGAFASAPQAASAGSYIVDLEPHTYSPMPLDDGGTVTKLTLSQFQSFYYSPSYMVSTLPFTFTFYGQPYTQITLMGNGTVSMGSTTFPSSTDTEAVVDRHIIPSATALRHNFIAVWQDKMVCDTAQKVKTQVVGQPGSQFFVIEWEACRKYAVTAAATAQLWLGENGEIEVHYGPASGTWTAGMGIENADGTDGTPGIALNGTTCNPNCSTADFPTNHRLVYIGEPRVAFDALSVTPQTVTTGATVSIQALVSNQGRSATNAAMRFWIGPSASMTDARDIGLATGVDIPSGTSTASFALDFDTTDLAPGTYYVVAEFDPFGTIVPLTEPRKITTSRITIREPTSALRVIGGTLEAPGWVEAQATFDVTWDVDNLDLLEATNAMFYVVLSSDMVIGEDDAVIGVGHFSLAANSRTSMTKTVTLPQGLAEGRYWIGVWLDPYGEIPHENRAGNRRIANAQTTVGLELEIVTTDLPGGRVGDAYAAELHATGGDGTYTWAVSAGSLPPGIVIDRVAGVDRLSGIPEAAGVFAFTLKASSDRFVDTASWSIEILPALVPLEISTTELPAATLGQGYAASLEARGGKPPYTWSFDGVPPEGLTLSSSGRFGGTPVLEGRMAFSVAVQDASSARRTLPMSLDVGVAPLACGDVTNLAPLKTGSPIHQVTLYATGGKAPYVWKSVKGAVPGLAVSAEGTVDGTPSEAGTYDWTVAVTDALGSGSECRVRMEVTEEPKPVELQISTESLPRARVLEPFEIRLEATGVTGTVSWSLGDGAALPEGLVFSQDGTLRGVPSPSDLAGEASRTFQLEVKATDSAEREARATLSLEVFDDREPAPPVTSTKKTVKKDGGGCQSTSGDASLLALGLALGLATLGRRRSAR